MKKQNGITLVALVITIIVLLILVGVTINLALGDNGILNRTKIAGEEYTRASIKEEIELGIADIAAELASKNPTEGLTKDAIINQLPNRMNEPLSIENDLTGEYKGYEYWIDENYVVHIGDKVNASFIVGIKADKIGTSYVTVSANATSSKGNIVEYVFVVDGIEKTPTNQSTYTEENLEEKSTHTIKVIATDEQGNKKTSREITIVTEARTYLYKEGNEYTDITGGWEKIASNIGTFTKEPTYMQLSMTSTSNKNWNVCGSKNQIDLTGYTKICFEVEFDNCYTVNGSEEYKTATFCMIARQQFVNYDTHNMLRYIGYNTTQEKKNVRHIEKMDVSDLNEPVYVNVAYIEWYKSNYTLNYKIYGVWLEK